MLTAVGACTCDVLSRKHQNLHFYEEESQACKITDENNHHGAQQESLYRLSGQKLLNHIEKEWRLYDKQFRWSVISCGQAGS